MVDLLHISSTPPPTRLTPDLLRMDCLAETSFQWLETISLGLTDSFSDTDWYKISLVWQPLHNTNPASNQSSSNASKSDRQILSFTFLIQALDAKASAALKLTELSLSPRVAISGFTARWSPIFPNASTALKRIALSLSPSTVISGFTASLSPIFPSASTAALRAFELLSLSTLISGFTTDFPSFSRISAAKSETSLSSSFARRGSMAGSPNCTSTSAAFRRTLKELFKASE